MSGKFQSYRALVADALTPRAADANPDVVVVRELRFKPSSEAVQKAKNLGRSFRAGMAASGAKR